MAAGIWERSKRRWLRRWTLSRLGRTQFRRCLDVGAGEDRAALFVPADEIIDCADLQATLPRGVDLAFLAGTLHRLSDRAVQAALHRVRQATLAGALVIVCEPCTFKFGRTGDRRPDQLVALAESVGLRCVERRSSPSIYAEAMGNAITRWPLAMLWWVATLHWTRASHMFVFRA